MLKFYVLCFLVLNIKSTILAQEFRVDSYNVDQPMTVLQKRTFFERIEDNITIQNCSLEKIEPEAFKNVKAKKIYITENPFTYLRRRMFTYVMVDELYLDHNEIDSIEPGTFNYVLPIYEDSLQILSLTYNKLQTVTRGMFSGTNFKKLLLNYNEIDSIEFGAFENMPYLVALGLAGNKLQRVGMGIFNNLQNPMLLSLSGNEMSFLHPRAFENSTFLSLDLKNNSLRMVGRDSFVNAQIGWMYV